MVSTMISWFTMKHISVVLSTTEVEYIVSCSSSNKVVWLHNMLAIVFDLDLEVTCIWCDNHSCVNFLKNPVFHDKLLAANSLFFYDPISCLHLCLANIKFLSQTYINDIFIFCDICTFVFVKFSRL
jgi:hypothetical protein